MTDIERILSDTMKAAAGDYVPTNESEAAHRFLRTARRNRIIYPLVSFAAGAALIVAIVVTQRIVAERVAIKDPNPKPPAGEKTVDPRSLLFVYSADGDIWGQTEEGRVHLVRSEAREVHPTLAPDGNTFVFERGDEEDAVLVWREVNAADEIPARHGHWPAYGRDGNLAWLESPRSAPKLVVGPLFGKIRFEYELRDYGIVAAQSLTWSRNGRTVYFDGLSSDGRGWGVYQILVGPDAEPFRLEIDVNSGGRGANFFAATGATEDGVDVIRVCCGENPEFRDEIEIGHIAFTEGGPEYSTMAVLDPRHLEPATQEYSLEAAGTLTVDSDADPLTWGGQIGWSWLVSDGTSFDLVHASTDGTVEETFLTRLQGHYDELDYQGIAASPLVGGREKNRSDREGFAIWPEVSRSEVGPRRGIGWRDDPLATARHFVRQVVGWKHFQAEQVLDYGNDDSVLIRVHLAEDPRRPLIDIYLDQVIGDGRWSVTGVNDPRKTLTGLSVSIDGREVGIGLADRRAVSALVRVGFGGQAPLEKETQAPDWFVEMVLARRPTEPGYVLIFRMDENGTIYSVDGARLPAHDITAG